MNLNGFVNNSPMNAWDYLGRWVHPDGIISPDQAVAIISETESLFYSFYHSVVKDDVKGLKKLLDRLAFGTFSTDYIDGSANKWMFTCKYGWIDMGHFFSSAYYSQFYGSKWTYRFSRFVEIGQTIKLSYDFLLSIKGDPTGESAWTAEDLNSNYQGAFFSHNGIGTISDSFGKFARNAGAVKFKPGPTKVRAVLYDDVRSLLDTDDAGNLAVYTGDRIRDMGAQIEYQKKNFKAFCLFCDGDKPKEEYKY